MKKPPNPDGELRRKIDDCWGRNTKKKIVNKKPPNPGEVLREKPLSYDWGLKKMREWS